MLDKQIKTKIMKRVLKNGDKIQCPRNTGVGLTSHKEIYEVKDVDLCGDLTFFKYDIISENGKVTTAYECLERAHHLKKDAKWIIKRKPKK